MRTLLLAISCLFFGCNAHKEDPLVLFVLDEHRQHFKKELSRWDAEKIVLAARVLAPPGKVEYLLACGAVESHFQPGAIGDDGKSQGIYQVQWRYHRHIKWYMLNADITTNTRAAVKHMDWAGWDAQVYNAGYVGKSKGRGKNHLRKVRQALWRIDQWK